MCVHVCVSVLIVSNYLYFSATVATVECMQRHTMSDWPGCVPRLHRLSTHLSLCLFFLVFPRSFFLFFKIFKFFITSDNWLLSSNLNMSVSVSAGVTFTRTGDGTSRILQYIQITVTSIHECSFISICLFATLTLIFFFFLTLENKTFFIPSWHLLQHQLLILIFLSS